MIYWIKKFFYTVVANRKVWRHADCGVLPPQAFTNRKFVEACWLDRSHIDFRDIGRRRWLCSHIANKSVHNRLRAFNMNLDALFRGEHPAVQSMGAGQAINEWTKTHTLDNAANPNGTGARVGDLNCHRRFTRPSSTRRYLLVDHATVSLPSDLNNFSIFDEDGHGALSA